MHSLVFFLFLGLVAADNGLQAWLRYAPVPIGGNSLPADLIVLNATKSSPVYSAGLELQ